MKILSSLMIIQGIVYFIQSILGLFKGTLLKFGTVSINANYNIIGIVLGIWLIISGIGIWGKKKYAYKSTILLYSLLIIYLIISIGLMLIFQTIQLGTIVLLLHFVRLLHNNPLRILR